MIIATMENIAGHRVAKTRGEGFGVVVGEIHEYTPLLEEARGLIEPVAG